MAKKLPRWEIALLRICAFTSLALAFFWLSVGPIAFGSAELAYAFIVLLLATATASLWRFFGSRIFLAIGASTIGVLFAYDIYLTIYDHIAGCTYVPGRLDGCAPLAVPGLQIAISGLVSALFLFVGSRAVWRLVRK